MFNTSEKKFKDSREEIAFIANMWKNLDEIEKNIYREASKKISMGDGSIEQFLDSRSAKQDQAPISAPFEEEQKQDENLPSQEKNLQLTKTLMEKCTVEESKVYEEQPMNLLTVFEQ